MPKTPLISQLLIKVLSVDLFWEGKQGLRGKPSDNWFHIETHHRGRERVFWFGSLYIIISRLGQY